MKMTLIKGGEWVSESLKHLPREKQNNKRDLVAYRYFSSLECNLRGGRGGEQDIEEGAKQA